MLSADELERYARHIVLREVGGPGQAALKRARVLVVGAGGLGAPVLLYLAAAGVGTLGVSTTTRSSLSNLQRQVIHGTPDIGAAEGRERSRRRSAGSIRMWRSRLHADAAHRRQRARSRSARYDLVADGSDNFATRYLVSDACFFAQEAAGHRRGRHVRRHAHHHPRARAHGRRHAEPDLSLPVSGAAAARHACRPARRPACSARWPACSAR